MRWSAYGKLQTQLRRHTQGGSRVREFRMHGSVRGAAGNSRPYRDQILNRGFCPNCGSRLFGKPDFKPELMVIMAGTLDDPSRHKPTMDIYAESAQPWDYMNPHLPKVPKAPQLPGEQ